MPPIVWNTRICYYDLITTSEGPISHRPWYKLTNSYLVVVVKTQWCVKIAPSSGERVRAWIKTTLVPSKFFLLLLYINESTVEIQLGYYCYSSFSHKTFWIWKAWFEIFIEVWFWLYGVALMANDNLLRKAKRKTWSYQK